jgi:hypothetical protein
MLNPTTVLADTLGQNLLDGYREVFGEREPFFANGLKEAAKLVIERIAGSDALYHDTHHTMMVTLVAQDILRGLRLEKTLQPADWYHFIIAALTHDLGYVRGVCAGDSGDRYVIDDAGHTVTPPRGASDAFLTPWHVDRSKIAVRERFRLVPQVDGERIARAIEFTRFPVPDDGHHVETDTEPGLLRAADLIGQLADPLYPSKLNALYYEFAETGQNKLFGYNSPADLCEGYPKFFWGKVEPYLTPALRYLDNTIEGKQWIANLYGHLFTVAHHRQSMGPQVGT